MGGSVGRFSYEFCEDDNIQKIDDLYYKENIRKCIFAAADTVMHYENVLKALRQGCLYPAVRHEMKRLHTASLW